ncbi:amidohydrolase family protein [Glaciecola sp. XM2]|uniref:amidohydrolase family protein n=1 Tax=Glaciecola sp. XM2 TaxID=1914931 RepID=UPI001BDE0E62|nr:amidohydrolase family protein [Glaciecola sp. XM2]MBT1449483.1 amidohydrolase family protein [Glaciecola sp. XM2]
MKIANGRISIVDPHVHFIDLNAGDYQWVRNEPEHMRALFSNNASLAHLQLIPPLYLEAVVHIEAGFDNLHPANELAYIEQCYGDEVLNIAGINLLLNGQAFADHLAKIMAYKTAVGLRHIINEDILSLLGNATVKQNFIQLDHYQKVFELQVKFSFHNQRCLQDELDAIVALVKASTSTTFVLNHAGFMPFKAAEETQQWKMAMQTLGKLPNIYVKCSGWEMLSTNYTREHITTCLRFLLECFNTRVMLASNFPLQRLAMSYNDYWQMLYDISTASDFDFTKLASDTAKHVYGLNER